MTSLFSKISVFVRPHEARVKNSTLGTVFENLNTRVDGRLKRRKKSPFSKISGCVWSGPKSSLNALVRHAGWGRRGNGTCMKR